MDIRQQHAQIAAYTTEEVYWHLANNQGHFGTQGWCCCVTNCCSVVSPSNM